MKVSIIYNQGTSIKTRIRFYGIPIGEVKIQKKKKNLTVSMADEIVEQENLIHY